MVKQNMSETEGRNIIHKVTEAIKGLQEPARNIFHRDLHSRNVMVHFKNIVPTEEDFENPEVFWKVKMKKAMHKESKDMSDPSTFDVKLIDFGFAKTFDDS